MRSFLFTISILLLSGLSIALAQPGPPIDDEAARERIEELRKIKLIEALDLDEEQAVRLFVREKDNRVNVEKLTKKRNDMIEHLKTLIREDASDEALGKELFKISEASKHIVQQRYDFRLSLVDILSMNQIAKLVVFDNDFAQEIRRMILNRGRRGHGRGPNR